MSTDMKNLRTDWIFSFEKLLKEEKKNKPLHIDVDAAILYL